MLALTLVAAVGSGIVAGIWFTFSNFVMAALARLPADRGAAAMRTINVTVPNAGFFLLFLGTVPRASRSPFSPSSAGSGPARACSCSAACSISAGRSA